MAELTTLARPYAEAVARLARACDNWTRWAATLELLTVVAADPQLAHLAANPGVSADRVADVVIAACGSGLDSEGANLVRLLAENKRFASLPEILRLFGEYKAAQEGVLEAVITSPFELSGAQMDALLDKLEAKFDRRITAVQKLDPALIGGVVIQVGDEVMDASVRGKLQAMAATLKA